MREKIYEACNNDAKIYVTVHAGNTTFTDTIDFADDGMVYEDAQHMNIMAGYKIEFSFNPADFEYDSVEDMYCSENTTICFS